MSRVFHVTYDNGSKKIITTEAENIHIFYQECGISNNFQLQQFSNEWNEWLDVTDEDFHLLSSKIKLQFVKIKNTLEQIPFLNEIESSSLSSAGDFTTDESFELSVQ